MPEEIKNAPQLLVFLLIAGILDVIFCTPIIDRTGLNPHLQAPLYAFIMIAIAVWLVFGGRQRETERQEPAE